MLFEILSKLRIIENTILFYLKYNLNSEERKKLFYFTMVNGSLYRNKLRRMVKTMEKNILFYESKWLVFLCING